MPVLIVQDLPQAIRETKCALRKALPERADVFRDLEAEIRRQVEAIVEERESGRSVIPEIPYSDIAAGRVSPQTISLVKQRGACVVRRTFDPAQATAWDEQIGAYVTENHLDERLAHAAEDKYFGTLASSKPQIYGIYWSRPQVESRQSESLTNVRVFLNRLWRTETNGKQFFDPSRTPVYADRIRRRPPASASLGLSPHVDGGSVERWLDDNFRQVYRHVFSGHWRDYDPFDAAWRTETREIPSAAVCSMYRTFQGWTALTSQGKGDGTLELVPISNAMAYVLLRAIQDDVPEDSLCGALPGRALSCDPKYHARLYDAVSSIPQMEPGDTVFWHCDLIHAVENEHKGKGYSNVMYIASTPWCDKNSEYLARQLPAFLAGKTPPDFAPDDFEVNFKGRATPADLTPLGRSQFGFAEVRTGSSC
jgi:hypothetical protein